MTKPILLHVEIDAEEPISGRLRPEHGSATAFAGWLGLAGAIERALRAEVDATAKMRDRPS
jgi:hypothetical protein